MLSLMESAINGRHLRFPSAQFNPALVNKVCCLSEVFTVQENVKAT